MYSFLRSVALAAEAPRVPLLDGRNTTERFDFGMPTPVCLCAASTGEYPEWEFKIQVGGA